MKQTNLSKICKQIIFQGGILFYNINYFFYLIKNANLYSLLLSYIPHIFMALLVKISHIIMEKLDILQGKNL